MTFLVESVEVRNMINKVFSKQTCILFKVNGIGKNRKINTDKTALIVCSRCPRTFTLCSSLTRHMQLHTGQFKFYCDKCKKGFADVTHFDEHMRKHEGLKNIVSGKRFRHVRH